MREEGKKGRYFFFFFCCVDNRRVIPPGGIIRVCTFFFLLLLFLCEVYNTKPPHCEGGRVRFFCFLFTKKQTNSYIKCLLYCATKKQTESITWGKEDKNT